MLPFGPKRFGDRFFHEEAKALSLAVRGAGSWHAADPDMIRLTPGC
jgi:hypothetical protein